MLNTAATAHTNANGTLANEQSSSPSHGLVSWDAINAFCPTCAIADVEQRQKFNILRRNLPNLYLKVLQGANGRRQPSPLLLLLLLLLTAAAAAAAATVGTVTATVPAIAVPLLARMRSDRC